MPRIVKELPPDRADYSFGDLVYWHLFEYGTRPKGDPSAKTGKRWEIGGFSDALGIDLRTLRYWIGDQHLPDDIGHLEGVIFGDNPLFDDAKIELRQALRATRDRNAARRRAQKAQHAGMAPANQNLPVLHRETASTSSGEPIGEETDATYDAASDTWHVPSSGTRDARENSGNLTTLPPEVFHARPGARRIRRGAMVVAGIALLLGGYAWTRIPPPASGQKPPATGIHEPGDPSADAEKEAKLKAKAKADRLEAERLAKAADQQKKNDEARIAEDKRKAAEAQARAKAEQRFQVGATKAAVEQKRMDDQANAQALNAKLRILAQADGGDLCKQKLDGLSVPGFTLKCDTLIPFGKLLGAVPVSQTASSLGDCAARCRKVNDCVAFSFDAGAHTGAAACYLTGSIPGYNAAVNWIAGTR